MNQGFLGTAAPLTADVVLILELGMGVGLLFGAWLARKRHFRLHAWCQSGIAIFNLVAIALAMAPSFREQVLPRIPGKLAKPYVALATAHAFLGTTAELAALYIVVAAGTTLLPERLRVTRYKTWMRGTLLLWWIVLLLGFSTYARWYVPGWFHG